MAIQKKQRDIDHSKLPEGDRGAGEVDEGSKRSEVQRDPRKDREPAVYIPELHGGSDRRGGTGHSDRSPEDLRVS